MLGVYNQVSPGVYEPYSMDGVGTNPITTIHDGKRGTVEEKLLYVRSNNANSYTNIQVKTMSKTLDDDIGSGSNPGATGWGVKLLAQETQPTASQWAQADYGQTINIDDIVDDTTYRPFWVRFESPAGESIRNKENIVLYLLYTDLGIP